MGIVGTPVVAALTYYPVKGCAGTTVTRAVLAETGLTHDRSFMLVDPDGTFLSQRVLPAMATIRPTVHDDGARLELAAPGFDNTKLDVLFDGPRRPVSLFNRWFGVGVDQGDRIADWLGAVIGQPCRLVRVPPEHHRTSVGQTPGLALFADGHAVLICSQSSLDGLNARIVARGAEPVPMNRFRPNVVVSGWPVPHTEDRVERMTIGAAELGYAKRCVRCAVPTVVQHTGRRLGPEPIRTLADYRREPEGGVSFGMKAAVLRGGPLAVGDPVRVSSWLD